METNQPITSSSSSSGDNDSHPHPQPDPDDSVPQSAADDVSFGFNHLQIDANDDDEDQEEEDDDGDFTFMCLGDNINDLPNTEIFENGQIRKAFPLFDQSLLIGGDYDDGKRRLPIDVPVDNVFIESPRRSPSDNGETDGTVQALPKESGSEMNMKSNSTGFSKLWRFRNEMNRSNSDGRDAFVFLDTATTSAVAGGKGKAVKKGSKGKKSTASAHEVYLKQKGGQTEEERRRSYLPYRPGLMGFFTNVNGGLSKNVHPF